MSGAPRVVRRGRAKLEACLPGIMPQYTTQDRPDGETGMLPRSGMLPPLGDAPPPRGFSDTEMLQLHWTKPTTATSTDTNHISGTCSHCSLYTPPKLICCSLSSIIHSKADFCLRVYVTMVVPKSLSEPGCK